MDEGVREERGECKGGGDEKCFLGFLSLCDECGGEASEPWKEPLAVFFRDVAFLFSVRVWAVVNALSSSGKG